jgi:hypothetical protein
MNDEQQDVLLNRLIERRKCRFILYLANVNVPFRGMAMDSSSPLFLIAQLNAKNEVSVFLISPIKIDESENIAMPTSQQQS